MRTKITLLTTVISLCLTNILFALELTDLDAPWSVVMDETTETYYVSSMSGLPHEKDNNGYISKINDGGLVTVIRFISGNNQGNELNAPKGMALHRDMLYVTDIDTIRIFDIKTGQVNRAVVFDADEDVSLKDIVTDGKGKFFVSDTTSNVIYAVDTLNQDEVTIYISDVSLGGPKGLFFDKHTNNLLVASWVSGEILEINSQRNIRVLRAGLEGVSGLFIDRQSNLYVSSSIMGEIYRIKDRGRGALSLFETGLITPTDISFDPINNAILTPQKDINKLSSHNLNT